MKKKLCVTTDFVDDLIKNGRWFEKKHLDQMMAYSARLGAKRHEWVMDTVWTLYDSDSPAGFDLLEAACEAAHRHGLRFDVVFKPFEGILLNYLIPPDFPDVGGGLLMKTRKGYADILRPFAVDHPEMQMARHPEDDVDPGGPVHAIRLVQKGVAPVKLTAKDFVIWTGHTVRGGPLEEYRGAMSFEDTVEWRPVLPYSALNCRVITLGSLDLPADADFYLVECRAAEPFAGFSNDHHRLVELVNRDGVCIPSQLMPGPDSSKVIDHRRDIIRLRLSRYFNHPEVRPLAENEAEWRARFERKNIYRSSDSSCRVHGGGAMGVMRGKQPCFEAVLNPMYPEVREHWLSHVRFCIERGVDGVNFRETTHNHTDEPWAYGFNEPSRGAVEHSSNIAEIERVNGRAYTDFLRAAADELHAAGREIGVHVNSLMFLQNEITGRPYGPVPRNIAWEWETWIRERDVKVELRGSNKMRPCNLLRLVDRIGLETRAAGIPFIFQSTRGGTLTFDGPYAHPAWEMDWLRRHPDVTTYNLYETNNFARLENDDWTGSPGIAELVKRHWTG